MDLAFINAQIRACEMRIAEYQNDNALAGNKLTQIDEAKRVCHQKQLSFTDYVSQERLKAQHVQNTSTIRFAKSYPDSMQELFSGNSFSVADNAFAKISSKLLLAQQKYEDEISDNNQKIENLQAEIRRLRAQQSSLAQGA